MCNMKMLVVLSLNEKDGMCYKFLLAIGHLKYVLILSIKILRDLLKL